MQYQTDTQLAKQVIKSTRLAHTPARIRFIKSLVWVGIVLIVIAVAVGVGIGLLEAKLGIFSGVDESIKNSVIFIFKDIGDGLRTMGSMLTALAFALALWQWIAARHESSFDKYYDRLDLANKKFDTAMESKMKL